MIVLRDEREGKPSYSAVRVGDLVSMPELAGMPNIVGEVVKVHAGELHARTHPGHVVAYLAHHAEKNFRIVDGPSKEPKPLKVTPATRGLKVLSVEVSKNLQASVNDHGDITLSFRRNRVTSDNRIRFSYADLEEFATNLPELLKFAAPTPEESIDL